MPKYEIAVPITGFQVFIVEATSEKDAKEKVMNGEVDTDEFDEIEWDIDTNNWVIKEANNENSYC